MIGRRNYLNTRQLINVLKDEPFFGISKDDNDMLLYTQHFMLSSKAPEVGNFIDGLKLDHVKDDDVYTWGMQSIRPLGYGKPANITKLYHKYMDAPRSSADYTLHAYIDGLGKLIGRVFAIENADNEVLAERFFKMFNIPPHKFTHVGKKKAFIIDSKHIVAPFNVYRTLKVVRMKMDGVADEEN